MPRSTLVCALAHCFRTVASVLLDLARLPVLAARSHSALVAENLFLRKQLALFQERKARPRRADDSTRWVMATLSQFFPWRGALANVKADTLTSWHRKGFRLFWRWRPTTLLPRSRLPGTRPGERSGEWTETQAAGGLSCCENVCAGRPAS